MEVMNCLDEFLDTDATVEIHLSQNAREILGQLRSSFLFDWYFNVLFVQFLIPLAIFGVGWRLDISLVEVNYPFFGLYNKRLVIVNVTISREHSYLFLYLSEMASSSLVMSSSGSPIFELLSLFCLPKMSMFSVSGKVPIVFTRFSIFLVRFMSIRLSSGFDLSPAVVIDITYVSRHSTSFLPCLYFYFMIHIPYHNCLYLILCQEIFHNIPLILFLVIAYFMFIFDQKNYKLKLKNNYIIIFLI